MPKGRFAKDANSDDDESLLDHSDVASGPDSNDEDASDSEEETWGSNAAAYYARPSTRRGRDEEESEGDSDLEERRELEDKEARKLQRKGRENMSGGDFGLEDIAKEEEGQVEQAPTKTYVPFLPSSLAMFYLATRAASRRDHLQQKAHYSLRSAHPLFNPLRHQRRRRDSRVDRHRRPSPPPGNHRPRKVGSRPRVGGYC